MRAGLWCELELNSVRPGLASRWADCSQKYLLGSLTAATFKSICYFFCLAFFTAAFERSSLHFQQDGSWNGAVLHPPRQRSKWLPSKRLRFLVRKLLSLETAVNWNAGPSGVLSNWWSGFADRFSFARFWNQTTRWGNGRWWFHSITVRAQSICVWEPFQRAWGEQAGGCGESKAVGSQWPQLGVWIAWHIKGMLATGW